MAASAPNTPNTPDQRPTGDLEHLFRQKFAEAEVAPRASFWDQLDHELVVQQNEQVVQENVTYRRRLVMHRWVAAACLLLALGCGGWALLWQKGSVAGPDLAVLLPTGSAYQTATPGAGLNPETAMPGAEPSVASVAAEEKAGLALAAGSSAEPATAAERGYAAVLQGRAGLQGSQAVGKRAASGLLYSSPANPGADHYAALYRTVGAGNESQAFGSGSSLLASFAGMQPRAAQLRNYLGLLHPDSLKPALVTLPQPVTIPAELTDVAEPEQKETPKLWRRLRLGGGYAVGSYNPNINFSRADGRMNSTAVTNALRSYYQDEAEDEYRRNLRAGVSQRAALMVSYALNNHWTVTSGAEVAEQRASSATSYGFVNGKQVGPTAADLFNRPAAYSAAPAQPRVTNYRYRSAAVPVSVRYGSTKQGLSLYAKVGAAVSVLLSSRSDVEGTPEATLTYTLKSAESPYRQVLTSVRGGTGVRYQPTASGWNVVVGPTAEAGLTTLNANPNQRGSRQSRPYSFGLEASVEFGAAKPQPITQ
ncbi:hypothetical protein HNQ93_000581 [Hymenobacter luteus]|uniref:Outer membrane protein beta-barrel domain-containing protein n=2 Tax=Hymenobacter TaxID=89966 RepID=A0A7W9SXJ5_9BACT|nr:MULTISPECIES: hypothetical protein [Hymenobacter]MBB4599939.1 hypothetical protein [Hymenobacter latericoloratus]MBB6057751.1 hypothetical protein [Hymenobacter luteus]